MSTEPPNGQPQNIATAVTEISERASVLIREEIELAKAEVSEKITKLVKGTVVVTAAGIFVVTGLLFLLHGSSWLLNSEVFTSNYWGFFVIAGVLFVIGGIAGYLGAKWLRGGAPPVPEMAIDEAHKIRDTFTGDAGGQLDAVAARTEAEGR